MTTPDAPSLVTDPAPDSPSLVVAETFSRTVQGEGPSMGRRASFIRLGGCNLTCAWCDTPYTWDASRYDLRKELTRRPVQDILTDALDGAPGLVVITGGEPLLHQRKDGWRALLGGLILAGVDIEVETNGTQAPEEDTARWVTRFNVSPKLDHAGDPQNKRIRPRALTALRDTRRAAFKFVCRTPGDVDHVAQLAALHGLPPDTVWIMPEGTTTTDLDAHLRVIADPAIRAGFNLTTRLHVQAWGTERGR